MLALGALVWDVHSVAMRTFRSDNNAGMTPEAMRAIADANGGHAVGYGDDEITTQAVAAFKKLFGPSCSVFFVATGTGANTLAVASLTEPWQRVLCHVHSHWNDDESTAPERITHCRTAPLHPSSGDGSKLTLGDIERAGAQGRGDVHQPGPGVLTISNSTEFGTVYTPDEMTDLCNAAHKYGYRVHVDGSRFANAVASIIKKTGESDAGKVCRALTIEAGVDALSFGGTKNGLAMGEAIVFFSQGDGAAYKRATMSLPHHRKGTGHLLSKHRFVSAPFAHTLKDGSWLRHATHANDMAYRLSEGMRNVGATVRFPTEANGVFVELAKRTHDMLVSRGHRYYPFGDVSWNVYRFMCSFDTEMEEIETLIKDVIAARH